LATSAVSGDKVSPTGKDGTVSWTVIVTVKRLDVAKSRLRTSLTGVDYDGLVLAMALDTIEAALASPVVGRLVLVTSDPSVGVAGAALGADVVPDLPDAGLNPALAYGAAHARRAATLTPPGVAALAADLPALRSGELTAALQAASTRTRSFVADAAGTGTVLLAAPSAVGLEPCFGESSAAAHLASGAVALTGDWPSLRLDVDTAVDLAEAVLLGIGPRSAAVTTPANRPVSPPVARPGVVAGR
jgi:2-phospho-L-lactate guanylyltransferase